jgi:hypothetical protein
MFMLKREMYGFARRKSILEQFQGSAEDTMVSQDPSDDNGTLLIQESSTSLVSNGLSAREAEEILVMKQLQDQVVFLSPAVTNSEMK